MKAALILLLGALGACGVSSNTTTSSPATTSPMTSPASETAARGSVYDFTVQTIDGKNVPLSQFQGKKLLIVNVASECGYTPQYKELEELYKKHGDRVAVLGFPANNFGGQEPGSNEQIATFCEKNYGVTFPMFAKISVKGDDTAPLYQFLADKTRNGAISDAPDWNFCKYLIDEQGHVVGFYPSKVKPMSDELVAAILQ
ncbi:glutathione peroxidase [Hymenobacter chitinivorans]|uniref:Glutathione peroxidase n=1 Tax=Hymenobacter chitinivorans DSM 11115 TaxID=1121954 RepID=A0A2M9BTK8_9BACT|nr:glutathione peroxidase [Hymenobacter chitinivorans]PJJ61276.1 glutathione peroxidase [Hymenobacter chitinivorans DSM 11115]